MADALVIGAGGAIGGAVGRRLARHDDVHRLHLLSRDNPGADTAQLRWLRVSYDPEGIREACASLHAGLTDPDSAPSHIVICNGLLHGDGVTPEKRLETVSLEGLSRAFHANAAVPLLWLQGLLPLLRKTPRTVIAVLSARVGSISDNQRGGWYGYRAAKSALNMLLKTASVELARRAPGASLIAFQPGTTESPLSRPFLGNTPPAQVLQPEFVAERLVSIMDETPPGQPLRFIDWQGKSIPW